MAPNVTIGTSDVICEDDLAQNDKEKPKFVRKIVWKNVVIFTALHISALYGIYLIFTSAKLATTFFAYILYVMSGIGITGGAHRLWSHRSYKAKLPLKIILMLFNTLAFQNHIYEWARDHRVHHKYSETDADPHNAKRGFFFSHIGWLLSRKHPEVIKKGKGIDLDDLLEDKVVVFQMKYYYILMPMICFIIPGLIPVYFWNETWTNSYFVAVFLRYAWALNMTWLVNSAAHFFGDRPYDKYINPAENLVVAIGAFGEGWHNYHHVFPWDYKAAELGDYRWNYTTAFIDFFAKIGWAYDMKTVNQQMIQARIKRTGDGSHHVWGWGDKDQTEEEKQAAIITNDIKAKACVASPLVWGWGDEDQTEAEKEAAVISNKSKSQ